MAELDSGIDQRSTEQARSLAARACEARSPLAELDQEQVDRIVGAMAATAAEHAGELAAAAVDETGYGVRADKVRKNLFAARTVYEFIRPMKTVGVLRRLDDRRVVEIAEPFGVVAAIVPSTNPTSTAIYKLLVAMKARCPIVISPHPAAVDCINRTVRLLERAARGAGAPEGAISVMESVTLAGTQELMRRREVAVILATGGMGLVRAAYSAGKPAYGVGPGNAPAYIERSADVGKAVRDVLTGKTFDNGLLCSSENSVVVDAPIAEEVRREFQAQGGNFLNSAETAALAGVLITPQRLPHPKLVGRTAVEIAGRAGLEVPKHTRALIAPLDGVGRDHPLSIEKLCPVLSFYVVADWREGCERCRQILAYGGMGHTMAIHSRDESVVLEFALRKPAFRIVVNTPATLGSIGMTTGLDPSMTLGCGGHGGNVTSDNISPRHLLNVKRLAYELRTARQAAATLDSPSKQDSDAGGGRSGRAAGLDRRLVAERVAALVDAPAAAGAPVPPSPTRDPGRAAGPPTAVPFVCEEDVRAAIRESRPIVIGERTIVTPAARDLAATHGVFVES
ncbi:MAG: aldehyde dehydrogenase family protein [Acidobacteria bacterium]|nr:aldehyde dehydrogenase family protein [Acidobacteriota bacterium]